ncbi:hypothetical protein Tco_1419519 [Tanacetum coccineum]
MEKQMNVSFDDLSAMALNKAGSKPRASKHDFWTIQNQTRSYYATVNNTNSKNQLNVNCIYCFAACNDDYIGGQNQSSSPRTLRPAQAPQALKHSNVNYKQQQHRNHPLEQVIGETLSTNLTRKQLRSDGDMCIYALTKSPVEPQECQDAMTDPA